MRKSTTGGKQSLNFVNPHRVLCRWRRGIERRQGGAQHHVNIAGTVNIIPSDPLTLLPTAPQDPNS